MREQHPFGLWKPEKAEYLLLGSFPGIQSCKAAPSYDSSYDWFYRSKRGRFWHILERVYDTKLETKAEQMKLMTNLNMAIGDIIESCRRTEGTNADTNLTDIIYNTTAIADVLAKHPIRTIYFTSSFVALRFRRHFKEIILPYPDLTFVTLPSPSPRYASMSIEEKIKTYQELLPHI